MRITRERMVGVLGPASKPESVWQKQFDGFDRELVRMAQLDWDKVPDEDFWYYLHDLAYQELQPDLFRHLFPACLKFWYDTLMRGAPAACGDADFHYSMMRGDIVAKMLAASERQALFDFFRDGLLDRIHAQRDMAYNARDPRSIAWIYRFNSLGVLAPVAGATWENWWTLDHPGKARCAVIYASGLVYLKGENPLNARYGLGPELNSDEGSLFDWAWRDDNLDFLLEALTADFILRGLDQAAAVLASEPEGDIARRVANDAKTRADVVQIRIEELLEGLSETGRSRRFWR